MPKFGKATRKENKTDKISKKNKKIKKFPSSEKSDEKFNCGKWSVTEHRTFIIGILLFGNGWDDIQKLIKTRSIPQALSHCQKFFLKLQKIKFFEEEFYSAKKLKEYLRTKRNKEKFVIIERLIKAYFKDYEIMFVNRFLNNNNNNFNKLNLVNELNKEKIKNDEFVSDSLCLDKSETYDILKKTSNEKFLYILLRNQQNLFCSKNLILNKKREENENNCFGYFNSKIKDGYSYKESGNVGENNYKKNDSFQFKNIENFLNFCESGIPSNSFCNKIANMSHISNDDDSAQSSFANNCFNFNILKKDLEVNNYSYSISKELDFDLQIRNISKSNLFILFYYHF